MNQDEEVATAMAMPAVYINRFMIGIAGNQARIAIGEGYNDGSTNWRMAISMEVTALQMFVEVAQKTMADAAPTASSVKWN